MAHIYTPDEQRAWQKTLPKKNVSAHMIVEHGGKYLIVKANYKDHWTFAGGVVDEFEQPKRAAIRELEEETGIIAQEDQVKFFGVSHLPARSGFQDRLSFSFILNLTEEPELKLQEVEIEEAKWVEPEEIIEYTGTKLGLYIDLQKRILDSNFPFYTDLEGVE